MTPEEEKECKHNNIRQYILNKDRRLWCNDCGYYVERFILPTQLEDVYKATAEKNPNWKQKGNWQDEFDKLFPSYEDIYEHDKVKQFISQLLQQREKAKVDENTSDGYHTFKELYEFRKQYNASFFNALSWYGEIEVYKSKKHSDGQECFGGGWFIVVANLPTGQISNHYELKDWDLFKIKEHVVADRWDGHTPQDVLERLNKFNLSLLENN